MNKRRQTVSQDSQDSQRPLSAAELAAFRRRLEARAEELRRELDAVRSERMRASVDARETVGDAGDQGAYRARDELRSAEEARDANELQAIGSALARIEQGGYGECIDCGIQIDRARLQAQPTALRCIDCQQHQDRLQAISGGAGP